MNPRILGGILIPILFLIVLTKYYKKTLVFSNTIYGKLLFLCVVLFYAEMNIKYGFLALVFVVFFYKIFISGPYGSLPAAPIVSKRTDIPDEPTIVPLIIYQTWHSKQLPPKMAACVENLKKSNPEFEHQLFDDADCRSYIKDNYEEDVLDAYDRLVPGAFKADLWRYCVLYKTGGIYLDIKFQCEPGFSLLELTQDPDTFVLDQPYSNIGVSLETELKMLNSPTFVDSFMNNTAPQLWKNKQVGLYNAVIATIPNNPILYDCIRQIVKNVRTQYYGFRSLYPTGPGLLGEVYFKTEYRNKLPEIKYFNSVVGNYIINKKRKVISQYPEYRQEQKQYPKKGPNFYYNDLWYKQQVYVIVANSDKLVNK